MRLGPSSLIVPVVGMSFVLAAATVPPATWAGTAMPSLGAGVAAVSLMALAAVLGARWSWVESLFGGLDRVYLTHKWLGVWALVLASFHLVFKAGMPAWEVAPILPLPGPATRLVRQLSFVALMLIILLALNRRIAYRQWRWWHKLSGPLFLVVIAHWLSFKSPVRLASPAGIWLAGLSGLGVAGAAWKLLLYPWLSRHAPYEVVEAATGGEAVHLRLAPAGRRRIRFVPGQFAFIGFDQPGLREPHPFTLACAGQDDGRIGFVVRASGDYTGQLVAQARPGLRAEVHAPFGRFRRQPEGRVEIWIAGGVGVTPFLAWLQDPAARDLDRVTFLHCCTPGRDLPPSVDLPALAGRRGVRLVGITAGAGSPAFREQLGACLRQAGTREVRISFCGPAGLLDTVREVMREHGVPRRCLQHELFEFR